MTFLSATLILIMLPVFVPAQTTNITRHWLSYNEAFKKYGHNNPPADLNRAAEQGDPDAMFAMFVVNNTGHNWEPYVGPALEWLTKAAGAGHAEAQVYLGYYYEERARSVDTGRAVHWFKLSAAQGHAGGEYRLALCYLAGRGVELDEERGLQLLRSAADKGQRYAMTKLADVYARGIGEPRDENDRPINLLKRAATKGLWDACRDLVTRYQNGYGVDRDVIVAAKWYCEGAALDSTWFPFKNTSVFSSKEVIRANAPFDAILDLFLKAIKQHDTAVMAHIGEMYAAGKDVPRNPPSAWQWFNMAASRGSGEAATRRGEMEQRMTVQELTAAKSGAESFEGELEELSRKLSGQFVPGN